MRTAILFNLLAASSAVAAPGPKEKDTPKPSPLVGDWELVSETSQGRTRRWELDNRVFVFTADGKYADYSDGRKVQAQWYKYRADDKADPPTLDFPDLPRKKGDTPRWLYRVDGDNLTICLTPDDDTVRPKAIEAEKGSKNWILTFKRMTPKK